MPRRNGRKATELRSLEMVRGYTEHAPGSVLIRSGKTVVLCTASWENKVPPWKAGLGTGWVTAEYDMLPGATAMRRQRNRTKIDGRSQEIQRLIGRSMRAIVNLSLLGENSVLIDCDVLQADGGTRTASITGAFVALWDAVRHARQNKWIRQSPITDSVAAVSVGMVEGRVLLDLDYVEDVAADVDMNVVMTGSGRFVEIQGTGEEATFTQGELDKMVRQAARGIREITRFQKKVISRRTRRPSNN